MAPHHAQVEEFIDNATVDLDEPKLEEEVESSIQFEDFGLLAYDSIEDQMYSF